MNWKSKWKHLDWFLLVPYLTLCVIGIVMVFSASSNIGMQNGGSANGYLYRQTFFVAVGLFIVAFMYNFNTELLKNKSFLSVGIFVFAGLFIYLKFFGKAINGSPGWLSFGPFSIQPVEFLKVFFILLYAAILNNDKNRLYVFNSWSSFRKGHNRILLTSVAMLFAVYLLHDLGGVLINFTIIVIMLLASGIGYKRALRSLLILVLAAATLLSLSAYTSFVDYLPFMNGYMKQRLVAFAHPFTNANGVGQQLVNSYYAISNGGIFGNGIGNSIQKTGYLPEPNTDFIMAIISEELGIIGILVIMGLLLFIILRILVLGIRARSAYNSLICYGTATYMLVQTYFNVGGVIGILPITGVTFPFISYGGSSMMSLCICLGMVLRISRKQQMELNYDLAKGDN